MTVSPPTARRREQTPCTVCAAEASASNRVGTRGRCESGVARPSRLYVGLVNLRRFVSGALALCVAGGVVGCAGASTNRRSPSVAVRTCSMVGSGGLRPGYRQRALILGPLALGNVGTFTASEPLPGASDGRYGALEVIAIVNAGGEPVLLLPRSEWATVGLLYDPSKFRADGAYRLKDLEQVVRFVACKSPSFNHGLSQFDGGFVITRKQCVHLVVTTSRRTYSGEFPAGAPCTHNRSAGHPAAARGAS